MAEQAKTKKLKNYEQDRDKEKIRGTFRFHEVPGGYLEFCYRKYKGEKISQWKLVDGESYDLPYGIAKHLNESGRITEHQRSMGPDGKPIKTKRVTARYGFEVDFFSRKEVGEPDAPMIITPEL